MNYENEMYFELSRIDFLYGLKKKGHVKIYQEASDALEWASEEERV